MSRESSTSATAAAASSRRLMLEEEDFLAFLRQRRPHPPACDAETLNGYLTALIIGPRFIDPRQWIPLFVGDAAMMASEEATEAKALQSLVAAYNAISSALGDTPETWRPRLRPRGDGTFDPFFWSTGFLLGTQSAPRLWRPVLHGANGDIIAPIRAMSGHKAILDNAGVDAVAKAVLAIRAHFMPRRAKSHR